MKKTLISYKNHFKNRLRINIIYFIIGSLFFVQSCERKTEKKLIKQNHSAEIKKLIEKGNYFFDRVKNDSAYLYFNKAISLCEPKKDHAEDYVFALTCMANIQQNSSDYIASEESLTKTLPYLKYLKNPKFTYNVYTLIAYNYYYSFDYKSAISYHLKALKLAKTPFKKSVILNDIVLVYLTQEKYKEAAELLIPLVAKKIKHESDQNKTDFNYSLLLDNLGYCYYKIGNPKALDCLNKSLKIKLEQNDNHGLIGTYNTLSTYYSKTDANLSKMYAEKAYSSACKANSAIYKANGLAMLIQKSDGDELKKYSLDFIKLADSFTVAREKAKNQFARIKYDSDLDKAENLFLKTQKIENVLQIERQNNRTKISYIIILFTGTMLLYLFFHLTSKGKKEKNDAIYTSEIRISKKLHDELANNVYQTLVFAESRNLELEENKEELLNNLDLLYSKTRKISKENSTIKTDKSYDLVLKEMISGFKTQDLNILLNGFDTIDWNEVDKNKKITLYRVLQELLTNMKTHSNASLVGINLKKMHKNITVIYNDNGTGTNIDTISFKSGLHNIESRIHNIKGDIKIDSAPDRGFKVSFNFPL
ncbi:ATP-binding protein [Flavobacterium sp. MR2016-29]|uniref:tetratricopeptide repeat-containing sensor histidine kinase n=1 Tax=Flavobacterium sp. MR2016-29 TaxID=2783795 RepID=UPI00188B79B0|nr:tetratricopeptide repeat-containing sensor histidine kinase [Flavobacterium sp. MR2016-29]MBF4492625.1 ATP-binding protein [Flavobacterium sp. MR2016-29]